MVAAEMPRYRQAILEATLGLRWWPPQSGIRRLIERKSYFVLHAPRQVGKTTALLALGRELTAAGHYLAVLLSVEVRAAFPNDTHAAELAIHWPTRDIARGAP
jgi:hypothetical protein